MPDADTAHYRRYELQTVLDAGPHDDETWFFLQVGGKHKSKHLNITPDELVAIRELLGTPTGPAPIKS